MISELLTRLRFLVFRQKRWELDEEIEFHLEQAASVKTAAGVSPAEARRQAMIDFGGITPTRERCELQRPGWWIGTVVRDVHYAFRGFGRNPLFTISVLITLALGTGATTAVFSVVDLILFRPLPYAEPDRIVLIRDLRATHEPKVTALSSEDPEAQIASEGMRVAYKVGPLSCTQCSTERPNRPSRATDGSIWIKRCPCPRSPHRSPL